MLAAVAAAEEAEVVPLGSNKNGNPPKFNYFIKRPYSLLFKF